MFKFSLSFQASKLNISRFQISSSIFLKSFTKTSRFTINKKNNVKKFCNKINENEFVMMDQNIKLPGEFTNNREQYTGLKNADPKALKEVKYIDESGNGFTFEDHEKPFEESGLVKFRDEYGHLIQDKEVLNKIQRRIDFKNSLHVQDTIKKRQRYKKLLIGLSFGVFVIGAMSLWVVVYKTICEKLGYSVKSSHSDYKFAGKNLNITKKYTVKFISEVDVELPWEFSAQQDLVKVNSGETCLIFYKAKNKTDQPLIGISVYDVYPQGMAMYFNKIQCFCFENQMLAPKEEVDLPVFFYIDPAINEDPKIDHYKEMILKYTFYLGKKQDLAVIMNEHLKKRKAEREELNRFKRRLKREGKDYNIEELPEKFTALPGFNPSLEAFHIEETNSLRSELALKK